MKQEPELIDIFAMGALQGICASAPTIPNVEIVREAYDLAAYMMQERKNYVGENDE
jgi:hypothetical protein